MFEIDQMLQTTLLLYIITSVVIYQLKPSFMFHKDGSFKQFGVGREKTIYPYWLVTTIFGILIYLYLRIKNDDFV
tara:strand:- start:315 stop:539 length:225 start_codon:yes stop_codon:yes gene_type:complete